MTTASDYVAVIGALAAAITLVINTWYSAKAKSVVEDTNRLTRRHEKTTAAIQETVDAIHDNVIPPENEP